VSTETFDYVVVGGGTAGCIVASRLAEAGDASVLLLEAGGSDLRPMIQIPIGYARLLFDKDVNWLYETEPDAGLAGRRSFWPRGKVLGGSGSINAMVYMRGLPNDFDDWRSMGNVGWGYDDVLPFFKRVEDHDDGDPRYHGRGGPIHVTDVSKDVHPLCDRYIASCEALGFPATPDFNGERPEGVGVYQINTRSGIRSCSANEHLRRARSRRNLEVRTQSLATRVLFEGKRATGVRYRRGGAEHAVQARRQLILCGGAINTPQLLELSGVGDGARLQSLGIAPVHDSPAVGRNLQDHLAVTYFYRSSVPTLNDELGPFLGKVRAAIRYAFTRRGPLAMSTNQGGGFVKSDPSQPVPNLQLYFNPVSYTKTPLTDRKLLNTDPFSAFLISFNACRPTSRGELHIASADPTTPPSIRPNYLSTQRDLDEARAGCRLLRRIAATKPLADVITGELYPGAQAVTDDDLLDDFRKRADTVYHPTCTARMGTDPRESVVDSRLRAHGLDGLRIIDASVFPTVTSGNTNAPTVMVAEKGVSMLLQDMKG
jgi:choline dehydrogenase